MKFKNEAIVKVGDNTFVFHNTLTQNCFEKIKTFSSYGSRILLGTGDTSSGFFTSSLSNVVGNYACDIDELCIDPSKTCFVSRFISIDMSANDAQEIVFSQIALADGVDSPVICDYIQVVDDDGQPCSITVSPGNYQFSVCIKTYIDVSCQNCSFVGGDNIFIAQLLGVERLNGATFYMARGNARFDNSLTYPRNIDETFAPEDKFPVVISSTFDSVNNTVNIILLSDIPVSSSNLLYEIVLLAGDIPVARIYVERMRTTSVMDAVENSGSKQIIDIEGVVTSCSQITPTSGYSSSQFEVRHYSTEFGTVIKNPFIDSFSPSTPRFLSDEGTYICFVVDNVLHLYCCKNYGFVKYDSSCFTATQGVKTISIRNNYMVIALQSSPWIVPLKINDNTKCLETYTCPDFASYIDMHTFSVYDVVISTTTNFAFGLIDSVTLKPVVVKFNFSTNAVTYSTKITHSSSGYKWIVAINGGCEANGHLLFFTDNYNNGGSNYCVAYNSNNNIVRFTNLNQNALANILLNAEKVYSNGHMIITKKASGDMLYNVYFFPSFQRFYITSDDECEVYMSRCANYYAKQYLDGWKFFYINNNVVAHEMTATFPPSIDVDKIISVEYTVNSMIVFMNDVRCPVIAIMLYDNRSELLPCYYPNMDYTVSYTICYPYGKFYNDQFVDTTFNFHIN